MKIDNIITLLSNTDPEIEDRISKRKDILRMGGRAALTALPFAFGGLLKQAYAGTNQTSAIVDVLNFALTLEYLEAEFYKEAVDTTGLIPSADLPAFTTIRDHEIAHVAFLRNTINNLGGTPVSFTFSDFDYTGGNGSMVGPFATVFLSYDTLLGVSQAFEDTGVRAYKGQASALMSNDTVLKAALQIHSVEARHAAHIRKIRRERGANQKPWITSNDPGGINGVNAVYAGEENTVQAGIQLTSISGITATEATEAFDEPLTMSQVQAIVDPFIKP